MRKGGSDMKEKKIKLKTPKKEGRREALKRMAKIGLGVGGTILISHNPLLESKNFHNCYNSHTSHSSYSRHTSYSDHDSYSSHSSYSSTSSYSRYISYGNYVDSCTLVNNGNI